MTEPEDNRTTESRIQVEMALIQSSLEEKAQQLLYVTRYACPPQTERDKLLCEMTLAMAVSLIEMSKAIQRIDADMHNSAVM